MRKTQTYADTVDKFADYLREINIFLRLTDSYLIPLEKPNRGNEYANEIYSDSDQLYGLATKYAGQYAYLYYGSNDKYHQVMYGFSVLEDYICWYLEKDIYNANIGLFDFLKLDNLSGLVGFLNSLNDYKNDQRLLHDDDQADRVKARFKDRIMEAPDEKE